VGQVDDLRSNRQELAWRRSAKIFSRWGYFHDEVCLNKSLQIKKTVISKKSRLIFLKQFRKENKNFTLEDYRQALNYQVTVRQAQRDLHDSILHKAVGHTRGRLWRG
jgi:hypothetical protein